MCNQSAVMGWLILISATSGLSAAGFMEDFEEGLSQWLVLNQDPCVPPTPASGLLGSLCLHIQDGASQRVARGFDPAGATSICMEYDFYQASTTSAQRWFAGLAQNAGNPLANAALARLGADGNSTTYRLYYYRTGVLSLDTGIAYEIGWHHAKLTWDFALKQIHWQIDDYPQGSVSNPQLLVPDAVVLGHSLSNGLTGGVDSSVYFDNVSVSDGSATTSPVIREASSTKTHGDAGNCGIQLWSEGGNTAVCENRGCGPTHLTVKFDQPIACRTNTLLDVQVSLGSIENLTIAGDTLEITMSGVPDASIAIMTFPGIGASDNPDAVNTQTLTLCTMLGDVTNDLATNVFDLVVIRNTLNTDTTAGNFRSDINTDGAINVFDLVQVRNNLNKAIATIPRKSVLQYK